MTNIFKAYICGGRCRIQKAKESPYRERPYVGERVVRVRRGEQQLQRQTQRAHLQRGRPLVLQNVEADATEAVNVGAGAAQNSQHDGKSRTGFQ